MRSASIIRLRHHVVLKPPVVDSVYILFGSESLQVDNRFLSYFMAYRCQACSNDLPFEKIKDKGLQEFLKWALESGLTYSLMGQEKFQDSQHIINTALDMWKYLPGLHPLFLNLKQDKGLAFKYLLDYTWFVSQAANYLQAGIRRSKSPYRQKFVELYSCEKDHYLGLIKDLGFSEELIAEYDPTPGALAMYYHLHFLAANHPLSFFISLSLFEVNQDEIEKNIDFYSELENLLGIELASFKNHAREDGIEGHSNYWEELVVATSPSLEQLNLALSSLHQTKHLIENWYASLLADFNSRLVQFADIDSFDPMKFHRVKPTVAAIVGNVNDSHK